MGVAQIARQVGISTRPAFRHRKLSATEVAQQIQNRFIGRPYGKLFPRHAGSIAEFLFTHPEARREELLDFVGRTWGFRVCKVALWEFLKKYGLDRASLEDARHAASREEEERVTAPVLDGRVPGQCPRCRTNPFAHTPYAGTFLLWPQVLSWHATAGECFTDDYGLLQRGFLTSVFALVVGLERVYHLDQSLTAASVQTVLGKTSGHVRPLSFKRGGIHTF